MSEPPTQPQQPPAAPASGSAACRACGAALAADQRYCLNCGERRGEPRVDFRRHLARREAGSAAGRANGVAPAPAAPAEPTGDGPAGGEGRQRDYAPLAAAGGIAVLGVMLLIGVLIGRGTGSGEGSSAAPQVITVGAAEAGAAAGDAAGEGGGNGGAETSGKGKSKQGSKAVAGGGADTGNAPVASEDQLRELQEQSPEEYSESSAKLPDEIATPGEAPPTDDKAPGGGSGGTTIE